MKASVLIIMAGALFFCSCATNKTFKTEEKQMLVDNNTPLIVKVNGDTIKGKEASLPSGLHTYEKWIKLDGEKISSNGIVALQDGKTFYGKYSYDSSYLWAKQIKRGKINLYYYEAQHPTGIATPWGSSKYDSPLYFAIQKGDEPLKHATAGDIAERLKDNKEAYEKFEHQFGGEEKNGLPKQMVKHSDVLFDAIDIYNRGS
ncbi:hypothetical protein QEG73_21485 [Chitinophagaceae bacterium 26-R-25]|nr:hypothetical protein [Chitinophagaceae bacterium 26-R-25]